MDDPLLMLGKAWVQPIHPYDDLADSRSWADRLEQGLAQLPHCVLFMLIETVESDVQICYGQWAYHDDAIGCLMLDGVYRLAPETAAKIAAKPLPGMTYQDVMYRASVLLADFYYQQTGQRVDAEVIRRIAEAYDNWAGDGNPIRADQIVHPRLLEKGKRRLLSAMLHTAYGKQLMDWRTL